MLNEDIIFLGSFVSLEDSTKHQYFSQAANLYQKKFIDFAKPKLAISILPIFINSKVTFSYDSPVHFLNNQSGLKNKMNYWYRLIFDTAEAFNIIRKSRIKNAFFYNLDNQNVLLVLLVKLFLKKKLYVIVADYGNFRKSLIDKLFNAILKRVDGVVVLNSNIKCNKNAEILLGLLYQRQIVANTSTLLKKEVLLSGSLGRTTGLELALEFFSNNPQYNLYVTGQPFRYNNEEFHKLIERYTSRSSNIHFLGLLPYDDYLSIMGKCDIALSLRNPIDEEHEYNFPSKILEYLSKGKIVVSTKKYNDVPDGIIYYSDYSTHSLDETFNTIYSLGLEEIVSHRKRVYSYLTENFTESKVCDVINNLLEY